MHITPNLWFDGNAEEAAEFYVSVFGGRVLATTRYPEGTRGTPGEVMTVSWEVLGQKFVGINGGDLFQFNEAISFEIDCEDQDEVDRYWAALTADGGQEGPCGWCKDRFGVSWQVVPKGFEDAFRDHTDPRATRAFKAMEGMTKLDVAVLREAAGGVPA